MKKKTKITAIIMASVLLFVITCIIIYNFCPIYVPDFIFGSATIQGVSFGNEELTPKEQETVKTILGNKWYTIQDLSTDGISLNEDPFSENISIKCGFLVFMPAGDESHVVKLGNKYTEISGMEQSELTDIFYHHGQVVLYDLDY